MGLFRHGLYGWRWAFVARVAEPFPNMRDLLMKLRTALCVLFLTAPLVACGDDDGEKPGGPDTPGPDPVIPGPVIPLPISGAMTSDLELRVWDEGIQDFRVVSDLQCSGDQNDLFNRVVHDEGQGTTRLYFFCNFTADSVLWAMNFYVHPIAGNTYIHNAGDEPYESFYANITRNGEGDAFFTSSTFDDYLRAELSLEKYDTAERSMAATIDFQVADGDDQVPAFRIQGSFSGGW